MKKTFLILAFFYCYSANAQIVLPAYQGVHKLKYNDCGIITDYDGNQYHTVVIGGQCWLKEDLKVSHYPNGAPIPFIDDDTEWGNLDDNNTDDAYCNNSNASFYTWAAAMGDNAISSNTNPSGVQGACPNGWHLPSNAEWLVLKDYLTNNGFAGIEGDAIRATHDWMGYEGTDNFGFTALRSGYRDCTSGNINSNDGSEYWWTSRGYTNGAYNFFVKNIGHELFSSGLSKSYGLSVRCVKNNDCGTITDYDGNVYQTIIIGNQCWMMKNLNTTHDAEGNNITRLCYNNELDSCAIHGGFYTWNTLMNGAESSETNPSEVQGICPNGWHVPSDDEWKQLEMQLGMSQAQADLTNQWRGTTEGGKLKKTGTDYWNIPNTGATNETFFTTLGSGYYNNNTLNFHNIKVNAFFWTSTESTTDESIFRALGYNQSSISSVSWDKERGLSLRCVKN